MSCLFQSLGHFVQVPPDALRSRLCDLMEFDTEIQALLEPFLTEENGLTMAHYVQEMRKPHVWGGSTEIRVFCELYQARVIVTSTRSHDQAHTTHHSAGLERRTFRSDSIVK
jgi:hypothetical protein